MATPSMSIWPDFSSSKPNMAWNKELFPLGVVVSSTTQYVEHDLLRPYLPVLPMIASLPPDGKVRLMFRKHS